MSIRSVIKGALNIGIKCSLGSKSITIYAVVGGIILSDDSDNGGPHGVSDIGQDGVRRSSNSGRHQW